MSKPNRRYAHVRNHGGRQAAKYRAKLESTPAEAALARALDRAGIRYQQNFTVRTAESFTGYYLVDFRLPTLKLLIELDGKPHTSEAAQWKDRLRTEAILRAMPNHTLIRAWNSEVLKNPDAWATNLIAA